MDEKQDELNKLKDEKDSIVNLWIEKANQFVYDNDFEKQYQEICEKIKHLEEETRQ